MLTTPGARYLPPAAVAAAVLRSSVHTMWNRRGGGGIRARYGRPIRPKINDIPSSSRRVQARPEVEETDPPQDRTRLKIFKDCVYINSLISLQFIGTFSCV